MSRQRPYLPGQVTVSFTMIAHNEEAGIARAVESVISQDVDKEVLVVDDGSTDRTAAIVEQIAERDRAVRLIRLERNRGRGFARATGVRAARGRFIATIDGDILLPADWWPRCMRALVDADAVGGIAVPDGDVAYLHRRFGLKARRREHGAIITGSNGVYRREFLEGVSFDAALRDGEDVALNHALENQGARLRGLPDLIVTHLETKGFEETSRWLFQSGRGATRQLWRYRKVRLPDLTFAGWVAAGLVSARRSQRLCLPLLAYLGAASAAHVARAFVWQPGKLHRLLAATAVDAVLLNAYFCGRVVGAADLIKSVHSPRR